MRTTHILATALLAFSMLTQAAGNVTVYIGGAQSLNVRDVQRLSDLVTQPALADAWWPGAVIAEPSATASVERQHQSLLTRLDALAARQGGEQGAAIHALRQQLAGVRVTGRLAVNLDPDWVRLHPQDNPPLEGDYTLWAGPKPSSVTLLGLVSAPGKKTFVPGRSVDEYLDAVNTRSGGERSYAWVIYPDGKTIKAPVAYWNARHVEPTPGSVIFVGFAGHFFTSAWDGLNEQILHSLTHRIPD